MPGLYSAWDRGLEIFRGNMNSFKKPSKSDRKDARLDVGLVNEIYKVCNCKDPLTKDFIRVAIGAVQVFDYKQQSYGPGNIAAFGEYGVMVRLHDKLARLMNLSRAGREPKDETKDDTWGDMATYSLIALMCRWRWWPGVKAGLDENEQDR